MRRKKERKEKERLQVTTTKKDGIDKIQKRKPGDAE
jgi:hypothetical protein